jgi:hypothetical protein
MENNQSEKLAAIKKARYAMVQLAAVRATGYSIKHIDNLYLSKYRRDQ